mmetsp:Transcript_3223/g.12912  ORF Transcript_3223/g.12912 Transcript_3223/m.12912 type:complete len:169 (-) Transcript_3223:374-880(-)
MKMEASTDLIAALKKILLDRVEDASVLHGQQSPHILEQQRFRLPSATPFAQFLSHRTAATSSASSASSASLLTCFSLMMRSKLRYGALPASPVRRGRVDTELKGWHGKPAVRTSWSGTSFECSRVMSCKRTWRPFESVGTEKFSWYSRRADASISQAQTQRRPKASKP